MPEEFSTAVPISEIQNRERAKLEEYFARMNFVLPPGFGFNNVSGQDSPLYLAKNKLLNPMIFFVDTEIFPAENIQVQEKRSQQNLLNNRLRAAMKDASELARKDLKNSEFSLLVNPADLSTNFTKSFSENYTRGGWVIGHNKTEQPILSANGITPGFYTSNDKGESGITRDRRAWSGSYNNLMDLLAFYQNNATSRNQDNPLLIKHVYGVVIYYDGWIYVGSFRSLTIEESASTPFHLNYSFEFHVREMFHVTWPKSGGSNYRSNPVVDLHRTETPDFVIDNKPKSFPGSKLFGNNTGNKEFTKSSK